MVDQQQITPVSITANRQTQEVSIEWSDTHHSLYPFGLLRAACPCASCRGGHEAMRSEPDRTIFDHQLPDSPATRLERMELVGSYGLMIEWQDGHRFGIYNWHYLRLLCPCQKCLEEYKD